MICATGVTSHTGVRVVRRLLDQTTDEIRCLVRSSARAQTRLPDNGRLKIIEGDISNDDFMKGMISGARVVLNIAHIRYGPRLAELCRAANVERLVCVSSTRRFTKFADPVAREVIESENAVEQADINWTILRASMIYGGENDNNIQKLVNLVKRRRVLALPGGGHNLIQPLFVGDLVCSIVNVIDDQRAFRKAFTLAGPEAITYRRMIEEIASALGRKISIVPVPLGLGVAGARAMNALGVKLPVTADQIRRLGEDKSFDISPAKNILGFSPRPFREGLQEKLNGTA